MPASNSSAAATAAIKALERRGAGAVPHPGGSLLEHLVRTEELLRSWKASDALALAGLCHAAYGTDGFDVALLALEQRSVLVDLIGPEAESLVYLYASCDRGVLGPQLGRAPIVRFRDRFDGTITEMPADALAGFMELTFANELDIVGHNPDFVLREDSELAAHFRRSRALVTPAAYQAFEVALERALAAPNQELS